jgi:hypothetical protein
MNKEGYFSSCSYVLIFSLSYEDVVQVFAWNAKLIKFTELKIGLSCNETGGPM